MKNSFKGWLVSAGYDVGLKESLLITETAFGEAALVDLFKISEQYTKELLTAYTDFLLKNQYCDCDVYSEPPTAIDQFLYPKPEKPFV